jgi:hypothetical protein
MNQVAAGRRASCRRRHRHRRHHFYITGLGITSCITHQRPLRRLHHLHHRTPHHLYHGGISLRCTPTELPPELPLPATSTELPATLTTLPWVTSAHPKKRQDTLMSWPITAAVSALLRGYPPFRPPHVIARRWLVEQQRAASGFVL